MDFHTWRTQKLSENRAMELLTLLSTDHADTAESAREVAVALCAADRMMATSGGRRPSGQPKAAAPLFLVWRKWMIENHSFSGVPLSEADGRCRPRPQRPHLAVGE